MNSTPNNNHLLWANAIPMRQAAIAYAPKNLRAQWDSTQKVSILKTLTDGLKASPKDGPQGMDLFMKAMEKPQKIHQTRIEIQETCQANILRYIQSGALQSFAFAAPRTVSASPIELESRVWRGRLKWPDSTITHESLTFVEVRLITPNNVKTLLAAKLEKIIPTTTRPVVGRPTIKNDIEDAFQSLLAAGKFDLEASVKSQCQDIRRWLVHFKTDGNYGPDKPKYDAIRKHLKPLVIAEKSIQS